MQLGGHGVSVARRELALAQAAYYVGTGVFPFITRRGFEALTGPKPEWWLVKTVGLTVTVAGAAIGSAARHDRITPEIELLATGTAASLGAIDVWYVARGRIKPTYLLDAAAQAALLAGWAAARKA
jgi:hypothetical protein